MWLLWMACAVAGEIEVQTRMPMVVTVDGQIIEYLDGQTMVRATELKAGSHTVVVRNLVGKTIATKSVELAADVRVRMLHKAKTLTQTASAPMPQPNPPTTTPVLAGAMDGATFAALCDTIRGEAVDLVRKQQIETAAEANQFSTGQVVALLRFIDNDTSKGLAAKAFVGRLTDPQNAEIIASAFDNAATGAVAVSRF